MTGFNSTAVTKNWDYWIKFARDRVNSENNIYTYDEDALIDLYSPILSVNRDIKHHSIKNIIKALETVKEINNYNTLIFKNNELFKAAFDKIVHEGTWVDAITAVTTICFINPGYVYNNAISTVGDAFDYVTHGIWE